MLKYGLIPEFVGRVPVVVTLNQLDEKALVSILTEPKNALTKQYAKLFEMDGVELEFEKEALSEIAKLALERNTGARGLRSIVEAAMMDVMYDVPSRDDIKKCIITPASIRAKEKPRLIAGEVEALPAAGGES